MVSLIALAVGVALEKFGGGLSDNMMTSLIAIVAIFAGGNVGEHIADALKFLKGTKVGQVIEDVIPGDQGMGTLKTQAGVAPSSLSAEDVAEEMEARLSDVDKRLAVQAQNTAQIIKLLNAMRGVPSGTTGGQTQQGS